MSWILFSSGKNNIVSPLENKAHTFAPSRSILYIRRRLTGSLRIVYFPNSQERSYLSLVFYFLWTNSHGGGKGGRGQVAVRALRVFRVLRPFKSIHKIKKLQVWWWLRVKTHKRYSRAVGTTIEKHFARGLECTMHSSPRAKFLSIRTDQGLERADLTYVCYRFKFTNDCLWDFLDLYCLEPSGILLRAGPAGSQSERAGYQRSGAQTK